jgi:Na+/melibiose symporter-like transporter
MPWTATPIWGLGFAGLALMILLAMQERRFSDPLLPPRLFANAVFVRGVIIAFCGSLALFGGSFLLPLFFQLERGADAATSGALVAPFLGATCVGAMISGALARRRGKMKAILITGLAGCAAGFGLLATVDRTTSVLMLGGFQLFMGIGLGMVMPGTMICVQNAADRRDIGAATGCLLFLRSMGGAFGSTMVGALLATGFASRLAARGITAHLDLGDVRGAGLNGVDPAMLADVQTALAGAFHLAFLACGVGMLVALVVAFGLRDLPLRTTSADEPHAEPTALAH